MKDNRFEGLRGESRLDRLAAARSLLKTAKPTDLPVLHQYLVAESDMYVREALTRILEIVGSQEDSQIQLAEVDEVASEQLSVREIRDEAVESTARLFVHELRSVMGSIAANASREMGDRYPTSRTAIRVQRAMAVLEVVSRLADAAEAPRISEIDLTEVINQIVADDFADDQADIMLGRTDAVICSADSELVRLVVVNLIRNALEATNQRQEEDPTHSPDSVIVNWGVTDTEVWVMVLDDGVGLPPGYQRAKEPGNTTKSKLTNLGWGLTIAQQAAESMQGNVELSPRGPRGASGELRFAILGRVQSGANTRN